MQEQCHQSHFTDGYTEAETSNFLFNVIQQATEVVWLQSPEFNHHETHRYTDTMSASMQNVNSKKNWG